MPLGMHAYANEAPTTALALWDGPIERRTLVWLVRVMSVDREQTKVEECGGMSVRVRAYTFLAIPYSDIRTVCRRGVAEYRVFRRRHR